jgi:uncharacterized protein DUF6970
MKWVFTAALFLVFQTKNCNKEKSIPTPACILDKIDAIEHLPKYNPPATVRRYRYGSTYVYLFSSPCCDQFNYVYDKNCRIICAPSGGITGQGDGGCRNFFTVATDETLIWQDTR